MTSALLTPAFLALSARLGNDPLQVQGAGGNTSVKNDAIVWVKASGTRLADAQSHEIFVKVPLADIRSEFEKPGTVPPAPSPSRTTEGVLRPSIETPFHAMLESTYVIHTHSIATLVHAISPEGRNCLAAKLAGIPYTQIPYRKPGPDLTRAILKRKAAATRVFILHNHGLICCGDSLDAVRALIENVERRLFMPPRSRSGTLPDREPRAGYHWSPHSWLAQNRRIASRILAGSYYPDHVVFLGPALPTGSHPGTPPVLIEPDVGVLVHNDTTPAQIAMLNCLADLMQRFPPDWSAEPIGAAAEAALLDWDAERYRQDMAERR